MYNCYLFDNLWIRILWFIYWWKSTANPSLWFLFDYITLECWVLISNSSLELKKAVLIIEAHETNAQKVIETPPPRKRGFEGFPIISVLIIFISTHLRKFTLPIEVFLSNWTHVNNIHVWFIYTRQRMNMQITSAFHW